jgi:hypothetical protein
MHTMKAANSALLALALGLCATGSQANESFGSEFSHFVGGALLASGVTAIADHYGAENRAWIGFGTSVGLSFVAEAAQVASNGSGQLGPSALDFGANLLGAALGAFVTDRFILAPAVSTDAQGHRTLSLSMRMAF